MCRITVRSPRWSGKCLHATSTTENYAERMAHQNRAVSSWTLVRFHDPLASWFCNKYGAAMFREAWPGDRFPPFSLGERLAYSNAEVVYARMLLVICHSWCLRRRGMCYVLSPRQNVFRGAMHDIGLEVHCREWSLHQFSCNAHQTNDVKSLELSSQHCS